MRTSLCLLASLIVLPSGLLADDSPLPVTIYSRKSPNYERTMGPDGKPEREHYAIGFGGRVDGTLWDQDQEKEQFPQIAGTIAQELARQNYYFAEKSADADLLIVLHWGRTNPYESANFVDGVGLAGDAYRALNDAENMSSALEPATPEQAEQTVSLVNEQQQAIQEANAQLDSALALLDMEKRQQSRRDEETARVLGYTDALHRNNDIAQFAGSTQFYDLLQEVRDPRYYVIVTAYDFEKITKNKNKRRKPKPEWVTRFSIRTRGSNFSDDLEEMAFRAGNYFGRDSGRLIRDYKGEVEIGELQMVENDVETPEDD